MYVAKFEKIGLRWRVSVFFKSWSEQLLSHEIRMLGEKNFFFHSSGYRWINKIILLDIVSHHKLEIID